MEASRLARNGRDWHTLLEFCRIVGALLIDAEAVYDPRLTNDRLLWVMKGTISEMEVASFRARAQAALLRNPCYGGAFAYGKTAPRTVIEDGRARQVSRYRKPQDEWKVLLVDHHPGYISGKEYAENQRRLEANVARTQGEASGAAKVGGGPIIGTVALRTMRT
jgi:hypothetical protein